MAERFYTVEPIDVEGAPFTLEGLQSTLDKIRDTWGGKEHKPQTVSPALSLGAGSCVIGVEDGRVLIVRDDAAQQMARAREATEREPDGRVRTFYAVVTIIRGVTGTKVTGELVAQKNIEGEGLMGLFFNAAMFVQDELGDVPACMSLEECQTREASLRSQLSRARTQKREFAVMHFPSDKTGMFFEIGDGVYYKTTLQVLVDTPKAEELPNIAIAPRR